MSFLQCCNCTASPSAYSTTFTMISNGTPTYLNRGGGPLLSWRPSSPIMSTLLIALLTTTIAYQGKAIFFDLILGLKRRGSLLIRDLHIFVLSSESSALAVLDALLRNDWLTRRRLRGDVPTDTTIAREHTRIPFFTASKLLFLLLIGPVVNIVAISLTIETERDYSIRDAQLGALTLGVNEDLSSVTLRDDSQYCSQVAIDFAQGEQPLSRFYLCREPDL